MIVKSVQPVYLTDINGLRVVEWTTELDKTSRKEYHLSRTYTIRLYNSRGIEQEHNRQPRIDVRA